MSTRVIVSESIFPTPIKGYMEEEGKWEEVEILGVRTIIAYDDEQNEGAALDGQNDGTWYLVKETTPGTGFIYWTRPNFVHNTWKYDGCEGSKKKE
jgi:hypothetical protein